MNTKPLEKFAQAARRQLHEQVRARLEQVLRTDSPELRAKAAVVAELNKQIAHSSRTAVVERVAYTWFNRFCALRYMDANGYTRIGVISPAPGNTQPEILQEAKAGHLDDDLPLSPAQRQHIFDLLSGRAPATDGQAEAYRLLLVASCNQYHAVMPFLFEKIDDYSELLMPDDLLSASSVLAGVRETLTAEVCQDVEVIGWLYQFYISEKKDEVIGAKKAITPEDIPAATQLFTPDWIVRYLVQNSLGRLWLLNHPHSRLAEQMEFYIAPDETLRVSETLRVLKPEDLTLCDPAVGSGHMLTYAFDLLYAIYEEEGYNPPDIPRLILQKNLFGLEIDERAAALAAFALMMKARGRDRRFFSRGVRPAITVLRPIAFTDEELTQEVQHLLDLSFRRVFEEESPRDSQVKGIPRSADSARNDMEDALRHDLNLFREADNLGSLLRPRLSAPHLAHLHDQLQNIPTGQLHLFNQPRRQKLLQAIAQAMPLARRYHVVIANPPYLGNFDERLKKFAAATYPDSKSDLFAMFMERNLDFARLHGLVAMVNMQSWMFLSSYEKLRAKLLNNYTILSMAHLGARAFDSIGGEVVSTTAFVLENAHKPDSKGAYVRLVDGRSEAEKAQALREAIQNPDCGWFYRATAVDFQKIPGSPIAYWVNPSFSEIFQTERSVDDIAPPRIGMMTTDNKKFLRYWFEIPILEIGFNYSSINDAMMSDTKWFPYNKGGNYRKWAGNYELIVNWYHGGQEIQDAGMTSFRGKEFYFREGITWGDVSSAIFSCRYTSKGRIFDIKGTSCFPTSKDLPIIMSVLNSKVGTFILQFLNPTVSFQSGDIRRVPVPYEKLVNILSAQSVQRLIYLSTKDWDFYETSWDFSTLPLLQSRQPQVTLAATYTALRQQWQAATLEMQRLEEENNRLFIAAYGLQDELTPDVPLAEITLTCNPHYRYGSGQLTVNSEQLKLLTVHYPLLTVNWLQGDEGRELRLLADTMREFVSYAVGCMFGRYSLDAPGLILANQGETVAEYVQKVQANLSFHTLASCHSERSLRSEESFPSASAEDSSSKTRRNDMAPGTAPNDMVSGDDIHNSSFIIHNSPFPPDRDNAIPMLDGEWFSDDITERFKKFLRLTFGDTHYADNLAFLEAALGTDIRRYFLRDFYDHHVRMYKKRPIYWLFSSPRGSFNVLIYLHRYRPDTVSVVLNDYLREFRAKLTARKSHLEGVSISAATSARDKTRALKEIGEIDKTLKELREYEDDILYPLATHQVQIDLDDGVLVNYNKFGRALKKVVGLSE